MIRPEPVAEALASRKPEGELSSTEREVLSLFADGKCNKEIAAKVRIAEKTVKCHLSMFFVRLGVSEGTQAIIVAAQRALIHPWDLTDQRRPLFVLLNDPSNSILLYVDSGFFLSIGFGRMFFCADYGYFHDCQSGEMTPESWMCGD